MSYLHTGPKGARVAFKVGEDVVNVGLCVGPMSSTGDGSGTRECEGVPCVP